MPVAARRRDARTKRGAKARIEEAGDALKAATQRRRGAFGEERGNKMEMRGMAIRKGVERAAPWQGGQRNGQEVSARDGVLEWFAAYTFSCLEKRVAEHLCLRQIDVFLPVFRRIHHWKNGQRMPVERPLFPGYVFVKMHALDRVRVLATPGVHSLVGAGRRPVPLPYEEIESLRGGIPLVDAEPHPLLQTGERVLIQRGPLAGNAGILVRRKNGARVVLTLELIRKSIAVEVDAEDLAAAPGRDPAPFAYVPQTGAANFLPCK